MHTLANHSRLIRLSRQADTVRQYYQKVHADVTTYPDPKPLGILGSVIQRIANTISKNYSNDDLKTALLNPHTVVSAAQHHAAIANPLTMGALAMESLYALISGTRQINLTCGAVPLSNDTFPRGATVSGIRIPFLAKKHRNESVLSCPPLDPAVFSHGLQSAARRGAIDAKTFRAVLEWWTSVSAEINELPHYWQQISVISRSIYNQGFSLGLVPPIMLPSELVARELLLIDHAAGRDSWLERSLYDSRARSALIESLDGVRCFWNTRTGKGTYYFWHVDHKAQLQPIFPAGGNLVRAGGSSVCQIHPEAISEAVRDGMLVPATSYTLIRIILQCGLRNFGGPLQYDYLAMARQRILRAMHKVLTASEYSELAAAPDSYYVDVEPHNLIPGGLECVVTPVTKDILESLANCEMCHLADAALNWIDRQVSDY